MSLTDRTERIVTDHSVSLSRPELGSILSLADANEAMQITIREQRIDDSDAHFTPWREGRVRSYVVTLYGASNPSHAGPSPEPMQFLLISGPAINGSIDVVQLTKRQPEAVETTDDES